MLLVAEGITFGEAITNMIIGLLVVFFALAFLCFVISLFGIFKKRGEKAAAKKAAAAAKETKAPEVDVVVPAEPIVVETPANDDTIIAVITAAIEAATGMQPGSFVVRSLRRNPVRR